MWGQAVNFTPPEPTEDLKAFERRLREIINGLHPKARLWRIILVMVTLVFLTTAYLWLTDSTTYQVGFLNSLKRHPQFVFSVATLTVLFLMGAHKKVILPSIIAYRSRLILAEYNMTCDNSGKLILRPKPSF
ncbi:hypothetical protein P879_05326 [Paragonimus westermani]|uniref:Transmembrane protein 188 n=1 Tax=Paragonimus westermani TaxID=34504 RepID=A0A8T0DSI4_9TREM|nr:hypothetical protein P879_05326 [Paragonimus westermani]